MTLPTKSSNEPGYLGGQVIMYMLVWNVTSHAG